MAGYATHIDYLDTARRAQVLFACDIERDMNHAREAADASGVPTFVGDVAEVVDHVPRKPWVLTETAFTRLRTLDPWAVREVKRNNPIRKTRTCYDHLARLAGVNLLDRLLDSGWLETEEDKKRPSTVSPQRGSPS